MPAHAVCTPHTHGVQACAKAHFAVGGGRLEAGGAGHVAEGGDLSLLRQAVATTKPFMNLLPAASTRGQSQAHAAITR